MARHSLFIGTAGWAIPREHAEYFPGEGSQLERYSRVLPCAEINGGGERGGDCARDQALTDDESSRLYRSISSDFFFGTPIAGKTRFRPGSVNAHFWLRHPEKALQERSTAGQAFWLVPAPACLKNACVKKTTSTLTIRNVPARVIKGLKALAKRRNRSMEQEVRDLLEAHVGDRASVIRQIEASWDNQARRPGAAEVDSWIASGRE